MSIRRHIPNTITSMNLFAGSVAVIFALKGWSTWAVFLIMAAAIFDFLDGFAARLLKAYSPIGKELDSLADMISFGLAPSLLLYYRYSQSLSVYISGDISSISFELLTFIPLIIAVFSGLRLAKFNVDIRQSENFIGLPTPANALIISMLIYFTTFNQTLDPILNTVWFIPVLSFILSMLLVCEMPMFSMKFKSTDWRKNKSRYIFLSICSVIIIINALLGLDWSLSILIIFILYIITNFLIFIGNNQKS